MDRGGWQATVHGAEKNRTWLNTQFFVACVFDVGGIVGYLVASLASTQVLSVVLSAQLWQFQMSPDIAKRPLEGNIITSWEPVIKAETGEEMEIIRNIGLGRG